MNLQDLLKLKVTTFAVCQSCQTTEAEILREADKRGFSRRWFNGGTLYGKLLTLVAEANITVR